MAEFTDLSPCTYFPVAEPNTLVSVGWLGPSLSFQTGSAPNDFFDRLTALIADPWHPPFAAAGGHSCELCQPGVQSVSRFSGREFSSHSVQNIFVPHGGRVFVAPEGIAHYIACHRYVPPEEFMQAVLECPDVRSMAFKKLLLSCGGGMLLRDPAA